ncbi:MAG: hypothetical protein G8D58_11840 [gamma proteobacterium symbiont of Phacoides pectinatus]
MRHREGSKTNPSHPTVPEGFVALEQPVEELRAKQANGPARLPEYRNGEEP